MKKMFMLDIECTNTTNFHEEDILQIGVLELLQGSTGLWHPGKDLCITVPSNKTPRTDWDLQNLAALFNRCNKAPPTTPDEVRKKILEFMAGCGKSGLVKLCGFNATIMDIPFMVAKGYLFPPTRDDQNKIHGDYHYRVYELAGALDLAQDVLHREDRNKLIEDAIDYCPEVTLPPGTQAHDALYDCYRQTKLLNGLIRLIREGSEA